MTPLGLNGNQPVHKLRSCNNCDGIKPPEGGIDMGHKWICQACWLSKKIGKHQRDKNDQRRSN